MGIERAAWSPSLEATAVQRAWLPDDAAWLDSAMGHPELGQRSLVALELAPLLELRDGRLRWTAEAGDVREEAASAALWSLLDDRLVELRGRFGGCPTGLLMTLAWEAGVWADAALPVHALPPGYPVVQVALITAGVVEQGDRRELVTLDWGGRSATERRDRWLDWASSLAEAPEFKEPAPLRIKEDHARERHAEQVASVVEDIRAGRIFQACLTYPVRAERPAELVSWTRALRRRQPADYGGWVRLGGLELASSSPERFLSFRGREVLARPMKGTRPQRPGMEEQLRLAEKDRAENVMIVDLLRNDLGRVAEVGTVRVPELFTVEQYATVVQMTSTVRATLRADVSVFEAVAACFPPGSMSGAPKVEACRVIHELEEGPRGLYSGCIGWVGLDDRAEFSVVIRSLVAFGGEVSWNTGGGIVADSTPEAEWDETRVKLRGALG